MCQTRSRKRPRSASRESRRESRRHLITPRLQSDRSDSDDSLSDFICDSVDNDDFDLGMGSDGNSAFGLPSDSDNDSLSDFICNSDSDDFDLGSDGNHAFDLGTDSSLSDFICDSEDDEFDLGSDCDTSFESPASSYYSRSSSPTVKRARTDHTPAALENDGDDGDAGTDPVETTVPDGSKDTRATALSTHRDEIVAAILTIVSALGLTKETLHVCVDLLDRYLLVRSAKEEEPPRLETLSIACLWIAVKFIETPETIAKKHIKQILKRRRLSGNWTWQEILRQEAEILTVLNFRLMAPTVLNVLQHKIHNDGHELSSEQIQLAHYFADLLLLKSRANEFAKELLVDAIWFIVTGHQIADVQAPLLAPVVILFLAHRDNINPKHAVFKTWFALRCQYGPSLQAPWQVPFDPKCECRVCEHTEELSVATATKPLTKPKSQSSQPAAPYAQAA